MENVWKALHPKDSFIVKLAAPISNIDNKVITFLYQPMIGNDAFSLYHTMLTEISESDYDSPEKLHSDLLNQMNIGLPHLFQARVRLEGIGLLKVFMNQTDQRRGFLYEIQPPLPAVDIFRDDVMSLVLLDTVGERRFNQLINKFAIPKVDRAKYMEVTHKFLDVFSFNSQRLQSQKEILTKGKELFPQNEGSKIEIKNNSFDWKYFLSLLDGLYINKDQLEQDGKETIYTLHTLYGINELEMKQLVESEIDYATNHLNIKQLKQTVFELYHRNKKQKAQLEESGITTDLSLDEKQLRRKNTLKRSGFTDGDISVILSSENIPPMLFLNSIKKQKKGFVAKEEQWAVEGIQRNSGLPNSVINVLVHYILVVKGNGSFNQKFANSIANDWAQSQIYSPEAAITKVKELQEKISTNNNQKKYSNNKNTNRKYSTSQRKETLPEWAATTKEETPVSEEKEAKFKEQLRQLRLNRKDGES